MDSVDQKYEAALRKRAAGMKMAALYHAIMLAGAVISGLMIVVGDGLSTGSKTFGIVLALCLICFLVWRIEVFLTRSKEITAIADDLKQEALSKLGG